MATLAEVDKDATATLLVDSIPLLNGGNNNIRMNTTYAMVFAAKEHPEEVSGYTDKLTERMQKDPEPNVRLNAAQALALINTTHAIDAIRSAKKDEDNPEVRNELFNLLRDNQSDSPARTASSNTGTGIIEACPECSTDFGRLEGIPRSCPGCGAEIKQFL